MCSICNADGSTLLQCLWTARGSLPTVVQAQQMSQMKYVDSNWNGLPQNPDPRVNLDDLDRSESNRQQSVSHLGKPPARDIVDEPEKCNVGGHYQSLL